MRNCHFLNLTCDIGTPPPPYRKPLQGNHSSMFNEVQEPFRTRSTRLPFQLQLTSRVELVIHVLCITKTGGHLPRKETTPLTFQTNGSRMLKRENCFLTLLADIPLYFCYPKGSMSLMGDRILLRHFRATQTTSSGILAPILATEGLTMVFLCD